MNEFIPGQRWISNTESELGLGIVEEAAYNRVSLLFLATGEKRLYAQDNAPLTRVKFSVGDVVESAEGQKMTITGLAEKGGLITYFGRDDGHQEMELEEIELSHHIQFNKPQDRLFTGQFDPSNWFQLRYETWRHLQQHQQSPVKGLQGARASLIAHQLYIAHEAAGRASPRIMLADEVGLGKTIEAGLILHHRLVNGLSRRVLIIVPDSLLHQWLVEMVRRFNLRFSLFDEERCLETHEDNPFMTEQLILCSQGFFSAYPKRQQQALAVEWDMVIVDEAHHLEWSEDAPSQDYLFVEQLGRISPSLILLTATPEQLGKQSHFARLRLLDPDRFYNFTAFLEEEKQFEPVAEAAKLLIEAQPLSEQARKNLSHLLQNDNAGNLLKQLDDPDLADAARSELLKILLDHHGTGRILFRNSRQTVKGFPERQCQGYPLEGQVTEKMENDPRYLWLVDTLKSLRGKKALLICKKAQTAIELEHSLKTRAGIAAAVFHEGMSIIERDRAAAYFADEESAARLLICSEIGSEGRNFQFLHHLILFDLPTNPDLLQQRIGRLDRIGQQHVIQIHIPYIKETQDHFLYRWYDEGLNAFRVNCHAAQQVADILTKELTAVLQALNEAELDRLITKTQTLATEIDIELHNGRDLLLELNSCRKESAHQLIDQLQAIDNEGTLWPYLEDIFDCYGVDIEFHSNDCHILRPSEHLRLAHFPGLPDDGITLTTSRVIGLAREDLQFVTWEHPMVTASMDMVLSSETGNAAVSVVKLDQVKAGRFFLECLFVVECSAPESLQVRRFLPSAPIRVLIDQNKNDVTNSILHEQIVDSGVKFDKRQIVAFLNNQRLPITHLLNLAEQKATLEMNAMIERATLLMLTTLTSEIKRLVRLRKVNPSIREEEIEQLKDFTELLHEHIQEAKIKLDAVRFVITS
ncbi:RNA polymerase-associated protein RapA [Methylicorpusculum sp.]|uniref:RNA polymerase-associated protein RapA n=1 Tax=Methylicorpusculum sp. TaxID=2713644 RepID=UPI002715C2FE|nr:RNA polymerase-associated protein RapA [Methylicorpusculum sp.]MDO8846665.1 RNA polymerase-associated protein RapA [Methylicorpusculum sp.]